MAPVERENQNDDEMDLINAEFESMVSGLSLDQSSPTTFLDELHAIEAADSDSKIYANPPHIKRSIHEKYQHLIASVKHWWSRNDTDGDGAIL